ncbi:MAG TPA: thymidine phosphorylase [Polyangia bacterium]|nr:thymidine phosphorylase [Polyangia bacterium]
MRMVELIRKKRDGGALEDDELRAFVRGLGSGEVPDYQAAALLMAVFLRGLSARELQALTEAMLRSGEVIDLGDLSAPKVDKHSTGGVGDKISLALAPAVAACGVLVPMISGRGLGHTGGTLDKLESIPGLRTDLDPARFRAVLAECGLVLAGQSDDLVPADRKLYALRDVTGTVESIPLIASSIMSKKLAEGIDGLVLDVKVGAGAFMKTLERARALGHTLVSIGQAAQKRTVALLTDMEQPLGTAVGNFCEVLEAVEVMRGRGPADTRALTIALGAEMLAIAGVVADPIAGAARIEGALASGAALERFRRVVRAQGGDPALLDAPPRYPDAPREIRAPRAGFLAAIDAEAVGVAAMVAGAGRARKEDRIDPRVAVLLHRKVGDAVETGAPLATLHAAHGHDAAAARLEAAFSIADAPPPARPLIHERIGP